MSSRYNTFQQHQARKALCYLADNSTNAGEAVDDFRSFLGIRRDGGDLPDLLATALYDLSFLTSADSLLARRMACAVVLEGLRPDARNASTAFTGSLRNGIKFVTKMAAALTRKLRDEQPLICPEEKVPSPGADRLYRSLSGQMECYIDGILATVDLAKQNRMYHAQEGVLFERLILALEVPFNPEVFLAEERTRLNLYFLTELGRLLDLQKHQKTLLRIRADRCIEAGKTNPPYDYSMLGRAVVVRPDEPVRFSRCNMERESFVDALRDAPLVLKESMN